MVDRARRYTKRSRCPICDGAEGDPRGKGRRCTGFLSEDGRWARCSREELAGRLEQEPETLCYVHKLEGDCNCGQVHGEARERSGTRSKIIEATYDYTDESGQLLYQVVRYTPKEFRQRRPNGAGEWAWKLDGVRRVLYRLPEIVAADPATPRYIVEGEKDAETLRARGVLATTNAQGAGKWNTVADLARKVLAGRTVHVIADADDVGRAHAREIVNSLVGVAAEVQAWEPTKGKDITEHLQNGGTAGELIALGGIEVQKAEEKIAVELTLNRGDHVELAERVLGQLRFEGAEILVGDEQEIFQYEPKTGLYTTVSRDDFSRRVQGYSGCRVIPKVGRKRLMLVRAGDCAGSHTLAYDQIHQLGFFSRPASGLAFKNGFVRVSKAGIRLGDHSPDNRARFGYGFDWDPDVSCDRFEQFLLDIFDGDEDRDAKTQVLQEFVGVSLLGLATLYQRCVVCVGGGDEGKSTLAQIVASIFPPGSTESIPPQEWGNEYRKARLAGKLLNVVAELPESDILSSETFKAFVSGDVTSGRHIRQAPFSYAPRAGHLFLANRLPGTPDQTRGFWRRFVVMRFNRSFTGSSARDPDLAKKIIASELQGVMRWALEGAVRLLGRSDYVLPDSHDTELEIWRASADQVTAFFADRVTVEPGMWTRAGEVYACYRDWAESNGHRALSSSKFSNRMRELGYPVKKTSETNVYPVAVKGAQTLRFQLVN